MPTTRPLRDHEPDAASITFYPVPDASPVAKQPFAVLIFPGGAYHNLADHEGQTVAQALNDRGIDAAVTKYSLAPEHCHPRMIHDAERAIRLFRQSLPVNTPVAVLGFSAGGHLAASLSTSHDQFPDPPPSPPTPNTTHHTPTDTLAHPDPLADQYTARPDAAILAYPVVILESHLGSTHALLGIPRDKTDYTPDPTRVARLSPHRHVTSDTPPTFLWHGKNDGAVPVRNSEVHAAACQAAGVPHELLLFDDAPHGLGLAPNNPDVAVWFDAALAFVKKHV